MIPRSLRSLALLAALLPLPAWAAPSTGLSCKDGVAPWKGKKVEDLVKAWGAPTSEKALSRGRKKLIYDLVPDAPRDKTDSEPLPLPQSVVEPRGQEVATETRTYEKGEEGWKVKPGERLPQGPPVVGYEFEVGPDGTIVKARCKES